MTDQTLDQLAILIPKDLKHQKEGREEWIEGSYNLCLHLAAARRKHEANIAFGKWCEANGFGEDVLSRDTRAAAIDMGYEPDALRACLAATKRISLETIYDNEFPDFRPRNVPKTKVSDDEDIPMTDHKTDRWSTKADAFIASRSNGYIVDDLTTELARYEATGLEHQRASAFNSRRKNDGIVVTTGEKRKTRSGRLAEVYIHRKFVTDAMRQALKDAKKAGKKREPSKPVNNYARPLLITPALPPEVTGQPTGAAAREIDPETGLSRAHAFVRKYGHAQNMPLQQRIALDEHKKVVRLAPAFDDMKKLMSAFLLTRQEQLDDLVPMDPAAFIAACAMPELTNGAHHRRKVEKALAEFMPVLQAVYDYATALQAALAASPAETKDAPIAAPTHDAVSTVQ